MAWFTRSTTNIKKGSDDAERHVKTEGLWFKCDGCRQIIWRKALEENHQVCPHCGFHFKIDALARLKLLF